MSNEIGCPKCGSTQLTANQKGFSGKKAVAGAMLTGGIGLLAGTLGSKKIKITCLACGTSFSPGHGRDLSRRSQLPSLTATTINDKSLDEKDKIVLAACTNGGRPTKLHAIKVCQEVLNMNAFEAKIHVEALMNKNGIEDKKSGCLGLIAMIIASSAVFLMLMI